ncbi:MAG: 30S ribosomal protein S12 methylthiotransferase RimO [Victivallales bacterium]|jgi:ribosomal protein S12 methylthiotransferase|nr:30S ribosomal protein S12 methylthiotransferase RimO [Victivallales bacterium]
MKKNSSSSPSIGQAVYLVSLGCSKNLVDTEVIAGVLLTSGRTLAFDPDEADLYIINTCAFIPAARSEAQSAIEEALEWKSEKPERIVVVAGCLTEWDKSGDYRKKYPEIDLWTGVNDVDTIAALLDKQSALANSEKPIWLYDHTTPRLLLTVPHMAYLKIADGCDNCCSYCAIPGIRGALRSRNIASVVAEAKNLVSAGVKELLIIAQDITAFGTDRIADGENIVDLLKELDAIPGDFVIRLLYTHPAHYSDEFIDFMARTDTKVLPYLDIPLQHINDRILSAMGRKVTKSQTVELLKKLRKKIKDLTIRTTFITGFPGETEEEFEELVEFMKTQNFERCGVFPYSPEPGTPAAKMPNQIPEQIAENRAKKLMTLQKKIMKKANRDWIGREVCMLIDEVDGKVAIGRSMMDAPEIDNRIFLPNAKKIKVGNFCRVRITDADSYEYIAEQVTALKST